MNRLAHETSPYLLQHQNNPVDWYPWGPESLERAKQEQKPIFLSIGYSACHWCHVMEHESFENPAIARLMNDNFVCIKVDREERPDLDHIYMNAVQLLTGRGGWPMSVFLTPDLQPFYGGTYWPPTSRMGMPGFDQVLLAVANAWQERRQQVIEQAAELTGHIAQLAALPSAAGELSHQLIDAAGAALERSFDFHHGGFGGAPKFPHPMDLQVLLRLWKRHRRTGLLDMVTTTLDKMAAGGIYDHLGGGFHRYSVDERWLVPHFEKMLYDNALLTVAYVEGFLAAGHAEYARVARETCDYVLRDLTDAAGGFYSTEDADSEGEEGKFYVWTPQEIAAVLGADAAEIFCYVYDVSESGNFEGHSILNLPKPIETCAKIKQRDPAELQVDLAASRAKLLGVRIRRVRPGRDDKVLVAWNGLMIDALARAGSALNEPRYVAAAAKAVDFILRDMRRPDGRLLHTWRNGKAKYDAYLDDYAALANALVSLYEATFDERYIDQAVRLVEIMLAHFADSAAGGFFYTADDHEQLIARHKDVQDSSVPSGNALAATVLVRLGKLTGRAEYLEAAEKTIRSAVGLLARAPTAAGQMLLALDMFLGPTFEIVLLGNLVQTDTAAVLRELHGQFIPNKVVALRSPKAQTTSTFHSTALNPLFAGKTLLAAEPTLFICENFACQAPVGGREAAIAKIATLAASE
ncbi:MAG TPA: thioredoxin domain-containing protein [Pirellulales bacterium]|nr:thioredoxin domain-containing protein [Pirellulales bacterium]